VAAQHTANKAVARVCSRCLRYVGSVEAQLALRLLPGGDAAGAARARRRGRRRRGGLPGRRGAAAPCSCHAATARLHGSRLRRQGAC